MTQTRANGPESLEIEMDHRKDSTRTREDIANSPVPGDTIERRNIDRHVQADTIVVIDADDDTVTYVRGGVVTHDEYGPTSPFIVTQGCWSQMIATKTLHEPRSTPDWASGHGGIR